MAEKTALVVDDSKSARFAMRKFLESFGYRVETAESAEDAFLAIKKSTPEVVFLDHIMPGTDGFDALKVLRQSPQTANLPVVLCSSNEGESFVRQAREQGATAVLLKPPSPDQIRAVIEALPRPTSEAATPAPVPAPAPTTVRKVQPIRDPEVAIEQAVMKTLRDALPAGGMVAPTPVAPTAAAVAAELPRAPIARPEPIVTSRPALREPAAMPGLDALREGMEARLRKITQDLFVQIGEIKAQAAHIEAALQGGVLDEGRVRRLALEALGGPLDELVRNVDAMQERLRVELAEAIAAQNRRIDELTTNLRDAVVAEAHAVSERVVLNAASRISDQIAESILKVLRPGAAQQSGR